MCGLVWAICLFIFRKSSAANTAPSFLSDSSLFVETVLFTLVQESNDSPSTSVCFGCFVLWLGDCFLFFFLAFLFWAIVQGN